MYIAELRLTVTLESEEDENLITDLTSAWRANGQVLGREFPIVFTSNNYRLLLMIPQADSLEPRRDSKYVTWAKSRLVEGGVQGPFISVLGEEPFSRDACSCSKRSFFILYTDYLSLEPTLRCGDCFNPIPHYEIQNSATPNGELYDRLRSWENDYQACDTLQMGCRIGEKFGLREMSNHDSSLSRSGREICDIISESEGVATYYYLHRYRGKSYASEKRRKCPSCHGDWLLEEILHKIFDFKCDKCRLLSNIAFSTS